MTHEEMKESYELWCGEEEVLVQLRPQAAYRLCKLGRDGIIEPLISVSRPKPGSSTGETEEVTVPPMPVLVGKLQVKGLVLVLNYRVDDGRRATVCLHPIDVQQITTMRASLTR